MIPDYLVSLIREGKAVLFLGAGASREAKDTAGKGAPDGQDLARLLATKFLGGKHSKDGLAMISEYAISESSLPEVQGYVKEIFDPLQPTSAHHKIATFRWFGIATTNYDLLVERAYAAEASAAQKPAVFIDNTDRVEDRLRDPKCVPYLKIHGCITRIADAKCPLILTVEQYIQHQDGRDRLFKMVQDWGVERSFVFVGHSLQDPDIRAIILELNKLGETRARFFFVAPDVDDIKARFWEKSRVSAIKATFDEFVAELEKQIASPFRGLSVGQQDDAPQFKIAEKFAVRDWTLSAACKQFLETDITYVNGISATETLSPQEFYRGFDMEWSGIEQSLDVRRRLCDTILADYFLANEDDHEAHAEFVVLKAHAGAGKSIALRRLAWDASREFGKTCLWLDSHGVISSAAIAELIELCRERIYLFVDNCGSRVRELTNLFNHIGSAGKNLTVIAAERLNEWNISCGSLSSFVTEDYQLRYLSEVEIEALLALLEKHRALGTLTNSSMADRRAAFVDIAGRQLLVALYEATQGKKFEDIIIDEYEKIRPADAQLLYQTICVLNRLQVPVRANLIAHIHGIRYEDFKAKLFKPLEHIVHTVYDPVQRDYLYRARHSYIAEIVFERSLPRSEDRYDSYVRCLQYLNDAYEIDRKAIRQLLRARSLLDVIGTHELISRIYAIALGRFGETPFLLHQTALYEMHRPSGSLARAGEMIGKASVAAPHDKSIRHTAAEYNLKAAIAAKSDLEASLHLAEAKKLCTSLKDRQEDSSFAYYTLAKVGLQELKMSADREGILDAELEKLHKEIEGNLVEGLQRFPDDSHLLSMEAELASFLAQSDRARGALERAFAANQRNSVVAIRLARLSLEAGDGQRSQDILREAVDARRDDKRLHFEYALALLKDPKSPGELIIYHLRRSYTTGDANYRARLLLGKVLYVSGDIPQSNDVFKELKTLPAASYVRNDIYEILECRFTGAVCRLEASYCFIRKDGTADWVFAHRDRIADDVWSQLTVDTRVKFSLGFNFRGTSALDVQLEAAT